MLKQLVLGTVLGAIVLFAWSALAWMIIPWPGEPFHTFTNEQAVVDAIKANAPQSGNYMVPHEPKRTPGMTDSQYKAAEQAAFDQSARGGMAAGRRQAQAFLPVLRLRSTVHSRYRA